MIYNLSQTPPLRLPVMWGVIFLSVNAYMIYSLLKEADDLSFTKDELELFEEHFLPYGLTPTQYKKLLDIGKWVEVPAGTILAKEGEILSYTLLVSSGYVNATINKTTIPLFSTYPGAKAASPSQKDSGAWIGEVNFLDSQTPGAIATFATGGVTKFLKWSNDDLKELMQEVG